MALNTIIRPDGWTIPDEAACIHGIMTAHALAHGMPKMEVVARFLVMPPSLAKGRDQPAIR